MRYHRCRPGAEGTRTKGERGASPGPLHRASALTHDDGHDPALAVIAPYLLPGAPLGRDGVSEGVDGGSFPRVVMTGAVIDGPTRMLMGIPPVDAMT